MSSEQKPLRVKGWENGIASSPHVGVGLIRNADIESFPSAVKVGKLPVSQFQSITTQTFVADASTDICTCAGLNFDTSGIAVYFTTTGTLPAGLSTGTVYFLYKISGTEFKVCTSYKNSVGTAAGTVINITDSGTGVHTVRQVSIGTIKWIIKETVTGRKFALDSNGRVWFKNSSGSVYYLLHNSAIESPSGALTNAAGNGLVVHSFSRTDVTYLFVFRNAAIDVVNVGGTTAVEAIAWSNSWQTMNSGSGSENSHHVIKGQDDALYFCDDRYVGSIIENVGSSFDPATSGTFTYNNQALDLPTFEKAECLEELGTTLLIGGKTFNKIYPWDRISNSFDLPLSVPETSIKRLKNLGETVYILAGTWGKIYETQGTYVKEVTKLPTYVINNGYSLAANPITWGALTQVNGSLLFGVGGTTSGSSGVYRLNAGKLTHDNTPSTSSTNVTAVFAEDEFYEIGYAGGIDTLSTAQYSAYQTILHSPLYRVGSKTGKATYSQLEVQTAKPMSAGNIRVSYRRDTTSAFTTLATFTSSATETSFMNDVGIIDIENIQIQIEMDGNAEFIEAILYP